MPRFEQTASDVLNQNKSSIRPGQPRRMQTCRIPPCRTIIVAIHAPHSGQSNGPRNSEWQCGQKKLSRSPAPNGGSDSRLSLPYNEDSRSEPCSPPEDTVTRIEGWSSTRCSASMRLWLHREQFTEIGKIRFLSSVRSTPSRAFAMICPTLVGLTPEEYRPSITTTGPS